MNARQEHNISEEPIGLTSKEAGERLQHFGPNAVAEVPLRISSMLLKKFWGVIPWMLEAAIVLDIILGRFSEAAIIMALLLFQALLGFNQESRSRAALALLKKRLSVTARVKRDGKWQTVAAAGLVPDDIVHLRVGDIVPADISLTDGGVSVDQSQLTGESLPIDGRSGSTVYSGSLLRQGEATGIVVATGTATYFGKTAQLVQLARSPRRLQLLIMEIAKYLLVLDIALILILVIVAVVQGTSLSSMVPFALMLLVVSVPVMLPPMFTMSSAMGASKLAQKGVLTTRLSAIEDAATMDVFCTDKTGTITQNRLSVVQVESFSEVSVDEVLRLAALASAESTQDPIDIAVIEAAKKQGLLKNASQRVSFLPFDPMTKRAEVDISENGRTMRVIKGAPSILAELTHTLWSDVSDVVGRLSGEGERVIAVASGFSSTLKLEGFIALADPPREDSAQFINELANQGVRVILVTGDGEMTARSIAAKVGITGDIAAPGTIQEGLDPETAIRFGVFTNIFPHEKKILVQVLQKGGHVVGMAGDGVNDAPALAQADIGIATANATDVAKAAASLVLTGPGLAEIITAVKVSRSIYQRMQTWVLAMIIRKASIPPFLALSLLLFGAFALNPLLIVLFMLFGDIATFALSTDNVTPSSKPNRWIIRSLVTMGSGIAILFFLLDYFVFWLGNNALNLGLGETQTLVFVWLVFAGAQAILYVSRTTVRPFWSRPFPSRTLLLVSIFDIALAALMANQGWLMSPLPLSLISGMVALAVMFLVGADLFKLMMMRLSTWFGAEAPEEGQHARS